MNVAPTIDSRKPFAWSYSALKEYEICPRRYYECRVTKAWGQDKTPELDRGDALHLAMKHRVMKGTPLPMEFSYMESWAKGLTATSDPIYCEMKLSVDKDMKLTPYFDKRTWLRGVIDYAQISPLPTDGRISMKVATVVDYKTGRPKEDDTQLALNACLMFAHADDVVGINTSFLWTEYNDTSRTAFMRRDAKGIWNDIKPRVAVLEQAVAAGEFPQPKTSSAESGAPSLAVNTMASGDYFIGRIHIRLPDFGAIDNLPMTDDHWYTTDGRARLVITLKRLTQDLLRVLRTDPDLKYAKFKIRLYQWLEGEHPNSKLPKMRDLVNSERDIIDG